MAEKIKWVEIARRGDNHPTFLIDTVMEAYRRGYFGLDEKEIEWQAKHYRQLSGARWFSDDDLNNYINILKTKELSQPGVLVEYVKDYRRRIEKVRKFVDKYKNKDFKRLNNEELANIFGEFADLTRHMWAYAYNYAIANRFLPDVIFAEISKREKDVMKQNEYFNILMQLEDNSELRKEKISLLKIAEKYNDKDIDKLIDKHLENFAYLGQYYYRGKAYTKEIIKQRIEDVLDKGLDQECQKINKLDEDSKQADKLKKKLGFNKDILLHIESAKANAAVSNHVDEVYTYVVYFLKPLFLEIARSLDISYKGLIELRCEEVIQSLNESELIIPRNKYEERIEESGIILENQDIYVLSGEDLEKYKKEELVEEKYDDVKELKGQPASPGSGIGIVKLVLSDADASKVEKGDILVAPATNPTLVPAMERALAIITDEGGLLSHAAIVSRELGVPCIVGTKTATKVLEDGDKVEVDAERGIIKKL